MAAPLGNQNAAKAKRWADAIHYVLAEAEREDKPYKLRDLARVLVSKAADGDMAALKEVGDRLDGKAAQAIIGGDPDDPAVRVISEIRNLIVDPRGTGATGVQAPAGTGSV